MKINKHLKTVLAILLFSAITLSCKKAPNLITADATIVDTGLVAADGCGWQIKLSDNTMYSPTNLPVAYQKDKLKVNISYYILNTRYNCGFVAANTPGIIQIELKSVVNK